MKWDPRSWFTKSAALSGEKALSQPADRGGWLGFGGTREPFLGAWQRNLEDINHKDPSLIAVSSVFACVSIIAQDVSKLPLLLLRKTLADAAPVIADNHPIFFLLKRPNKYQTWLDFMQYHTAAKLMTGNSYIYKVMDQRGVPKELHVLPPRKVRPLISDESKEVFYELYGEDNDSMIDTGNWDRVIPGMYVIHDRINALWHPLVGVSPIFAGATSAATSGRIMIQSERFFSNMARPSGILTSDQEIKEATAQRLKEHWQQSFKHGRLGDTAVLGDGLKWQAVVLNAVDSQLIEQLRWTVEDVARCFRVPMFLLGDPSKSTYRNSEQAARSYYQGCLQYYLQSTEQRFNEGLGLTGGHYTQFDLDGFFRMEMDTRFAAYKTGLDGGIFSINEIRAKEGLAPVKGGEEPRVQMQYVPLSIVPQVAQTLPGAPAPAPEPPNSSDVDDDPPEDDDTDDDEGDDAKSLDYADLMVRIGSITSTVKQLRQDHP